MGKVIFDFVGGNAERSKRIEAAMREALQAPTKEADPMVCRRCGGPTSVAGKDCGEC